MRVCTKCKEEKSDDSFYRQKRPTGTYKLMPHCKACHLEASAQRWHGGTPEERQAKLEALRKRQLWNTFQITPEDYDRMLVEQSGVCKICQQPETALESTGRFIRSLSVDHDHQTGRVRGLLCSLCNSRLGHFESRNAVEGLLAYLSKESMSCE